MHYCSVTNAVIRFLLLSPTVFVTAQVNSIRVAAASLGTSLVARGSFDLHNVTSVQIISEIQQF